MKYSKPYLLITTLILSANMCFSMPESRYSQSLSRMETEWLHNEYPQDSEEIRLSRLEEHVFGTVHDTDFKTRYGNLQKAFDMKKRKQYSNSRKNHNRFSGVPTSVPMNIEHLTDR